jgi:prefoldin subunit 5
MCVTRVCRVVSLEGPRATVRYLDDDTVAEVDVSIVDAKKGSYLEVFADRAIDRLTKREAEFKRNLRLEMNRLRAAAP